MTDFTPEGVNTLGNEKLAFVPALADPEAPSLIEINGASSIGLSMAARGFAPSGDQGTVQDVRLGSKDVGEVAGRTTPTIESINYVYDPQAVGAADPEAAHYDGMAPGLLGYLIDRRGLDRETPFAVGDVVDVYFVELGSQERVPIDPGADGGQFEYTQKPFVRRRYLDAVLVA